MSRGLGDVYKRQVPVKVALHARGFACSLVRLPLVPLSVESHVTLMETLKTYGLGAKV